MTYTVLLEKRLSTDILSTGGLTFKPVRYSKNAIGGPYRAEVKVEGSDLALYQALDHLGAGLRIYSKYGDEVWWGYIHEAELTIGVYKIKMTMDNVFNRVRVAYTYLDANTHETGGSELTKFLYDGESINEYGLKELTYSFGNSSSTLAESLRQSLLDKTHAPFPAISLVGSKKRKAELTYHCRGWWNTLDWRYMTRRYIEYGYRDFGNGALEVGYLDRVEAVAQSFTAPAAINATKAQVGIRRTGNPIDNVYASIYSDNAGVPGTALGTSANVSGISLPTSLEWKTFRFSSAVALGTATTYWLVLDRDGSDTNTDYYVVDLNFHPTYANGSFKYYDGANWVTASIPAADMPFLISGDVVAADTDTATQIKNIIEDYGAIVPLSSAEILNASGISTSPYREGNNTAKFEIEEMLEAGTTNNRRLLARVLPNKTVQVYEEPAETVTGYTDLNGNLFDQYGAKQRKDTCPVAMWVDLRGVVPAAASVGPLSVNTAMFIEESEYSVERDTLRIQPREQVATFDFLTVRNG